MAIFDDSFTEASDVELSTHTPDTDGTGYTKVLGIVNDSADLGSTSNLGIESTSPDTLHGNSSATGAGLSDGAIYTADGTYPSADYKLDIDQVNGDTGDDYNWLAARIQDVDNFYAVRWNEDGGQIIKRVTSTFSNLGASFSGVADGSTVTFEVNGTTITFDDDGVELRSTTDSDISSAGKGGVGMGNVESDGADTSSQSLDNLLITDLGGGAPAFLPKVLVY